MRSGMHSDVWIEVMMADVMCALGLLVPPSVRSIEWIANNTKPASPTVAEGRECGWSGMDNASLSPRARVTR